MASSPFSTHLRSCAGATLLALGGETISYRPQGIYANAVSITALVEREEAELKERSRALVWTVHVEDHATRGITKPDKLDEIEAAAQEGGTELVKLKYSKTLRDDGTGIIVMEFRA